MKYKILRFVADLRFSIILLLFISILSVFGTIIEQNQSLENYKLNYPLINTNFRFLTWDRIIKYELDHVYTTWWFVTLIFLFGLSLTLCTLLQQFPLLKIAVRCQFFRTTKQFYRLKIFTVLNHFSLNNILWMIKDKHYSIFQQKNIIYCYKGLIGRIAPILVHFSMLLILFGTVIGSLFGFKAQEIIPKTESFHIQNILNNGALTIIPETSARINDFWIIYTKSRTITQFYSDISILDSLGTEMKRKTIAVNYPFINNNTYYYQTEWNLVSLRFQSKNEEILEYPLINFLNNRNKAWLTWVSNNKSFNQGIVVIIDNLEGYCSIYNETGQFRGNLELNETGSFKSLLTLVDIMSSTGLQVKKDMSIAIIYIGFFLLMFSTLLSYVTYSQIWIFQENQQLFIGGTTNRAVLDFELEFFKFIK